MGRRGSKKTWGGREARTPMSQMSLWKTPATVTIFLQGHEPTRRTAQPSPAQPSQAQSIHKTVRKQDPLNVGVVCTAAEITLHLTVLSPLPPSSFASCPYYIPTGSVCLP